MSWNKEIVNTIVIAAWLPRFRIRVPGDDDGGLLNPLIIPGDLRTM